MSMVRWSSFYSFHRWFAIAQSQNWRSIHHANCRQIQGHGNGGNGKSWIWISQERSKPAGHAKQGEFKDADNVEKGRELNFFYLPCDSDASHCWPALVRWRRSHIRRSRWKCQNQTQSKSKPSSSNAKLFLNKLSFFGLLGDWRRRRFTRLCFMRCFQSN